ncbi:Uncharacterised protein [Mycobacteroides abscessus subsp. abscessus]|nr:Uncharacterised protein [Mycobacteroides abscessus subsp. abscessus]
MGTGRSARSSTIAPTPGMDKPIDTSSCSVIGPAAVAQMLTSVGP